MKSIRCVQDINKGFILLSSDLSTFFHIFIVCPAQPAAKGTFCDFISTMDIFL